MSGPIATFDEAAMRGELRELVRQTVEDALNALLEEEADDLVGADRYERRPLRARAHHHLGADDPEDAEAHGHEVRHGDHRAPRRRWSRLHLAGVSTRRIEDVSEILWGSSVSATAVSNLNDKALGAVEEWRSRPLAREHPYVFVDGIYLKRAWGGSFENVAAMVAVGVNDDGYREVVGAAEGFTESSECWRESLSRLKGRRHDRRHRRGVPGRRPPEVRGALLPQRAREGAEIEEEPGGAHAQGRPRPGVAGGQLGEGWRRRQIGRHEAGGGQVRPRRRRGDADLHALPHAALAAHPHQQRHRAAEPRVRRRTRAVGAFPDGNSALMLVTAGLKYVADSERGSRRYLEVSLLDERPCRRPAAACWNLRKSPDGTLIP